MKKAFLFIAAAMAIFAGCKKEQPAQALKSDNIIHIGVKQIAPATKVAADDITADKLSFNWEEGDQVCFINTSSNIIYTCTNPETGEFSGEALDPEATYEVHYPASFVESYVFSGIYRGNQIPKAHHIANWSVSGSATTFTLDAHDPIIHFKLKGDAKIGKIKLSNAQEGQPIYTLSCGDEGVQLSDESIDFYMDAHLLDKNRLSGYAYTLSIRDTQDAELKSVSFHLTATNLGTMVDFSTPIEVNASSLPEGALSGVFSVSATKQVHFSKGNLYYDGSKFNFEANQYDFRTYAGKNSCINGASRTTGTPTSHWGLFGWVGASSSFTGDARYGVSTSTKASDYGNVASEALKSDWGNTIDNSGTWRTLSTTEWQYLFDNHVKVWGQCKSVNGYFIAPDGFVGDATALTSAVTDWASAEAAGIVFLPAAGDRGGSNVIDVGVSGFYWSSTAFGSNSAYYVGFNSSTVRPDLSVFRYLGYSVRLVTESK